MQIEPPQTEVQNETIRPRRHRWLAWAVIVVVILIVFIALLPSLASIGPIRDLLLRVALRNVDGSVHAGSAELGWFSPIHFTDIAIRSSDGQPVVTVDQLQGNRPLWQLVFGSNLGDFRVERPQVNIVVDQKGSNLAQVFTGAEPGKEKKASKSPNIALGVALIDGSVSVRGRDSAKGWTADPINFAFRLRPSWETKDGQPRLEIEPGVLFDNTQITPEVCHDLLKYIAPVAADTTEASGRFSMELERWEFPMADFAAGEGAGRLTIHKLNIGPGPLVKELVGALQLPGNLVRVENEPITFKMADGRVYHSQFTFYIERIEVSTSGSVGVADGSLDMTAELKLSGSPPPDRPILAALARQTIRIPIHGTLKQPQVDGQAVVRSLSKSGINVLDNVLKNDEVDLEKLLKEVQKRRQQRLERRAKSSGQPNDQTDRPLLKRLRGVINEVTRPPEEPEEKE